MPESSALHDIKQAANDNIGVMSAHLTAENAGIESLLDEGRETTFNLTSMKNTDGQTILFTPSTFFGPLEAVSATQLDRLAIEADFIQNKVKVTGDAKTAFIENPAKGTYGPLAGSEDIHFEASADIETLLAKQTTPGQLNMSIKDSLMDADKKLIVEQTSDCLANISAQGPNPFDGICTGKITTASGAEYDFNRKATLATSILTLKSNGKEVGTVETDSQVTAQGTTYTVKVTPAP